MPLESILQIAEAQEERCTIRNGEQILCPYRAVAGTGRCEKHGGYLKEEYSIKAEERSYNLAKWRTTLDRFGDSPTLKSLREEIAIARMSLEAIVNKCEDQFDLAMNAPKICLMLSQIEKLVVSCNRLEDRLGLVLDRSAVINLAENIVQVISGHVDPDVLEQVALKIQEAVEASGRVPLKSIE